MKIIHIVLGRANPNRMNGVNRVVHNLATAQNKLGMDVAVWGITNSANSAADDLERAYSTRWFLPSPISFFVSSKLRKAIENENATFHLHGGFIPVYFLLSSILKKLKKAMFLTPHGTYTLGAMQGNGFVKKWYFRYLEKKLIARLDSVQCLGHCEKSDLLKLVPNAKISLIPNGQNWDELKTNKTSPHSNQLVIGYCGRLTKWQKGLDVLMEGFYYYKSKLKGGGMLHLVGDGEYGGEMKEYATVNNIIDSVKFYGAKFGEEKVVLLKSMDVFVHTSRNEGLPTAVIEAMSLGVPCIVSEMTSMDTYINEHNAGWALDNLNEIEVANKFMQAELLYEKGELGQLGENAVKLSRASFDWNIIAKQSIEMYEGV